MENTPPRETDPLSGGESEKWTDLGIFVGTETNP